MTNRPAERPLAGRVALITGASRSIGIGAAIARSLAAMGADIFLTYFRPYDAEMPWGSLDADVDLLRAEVEQHGVSSGAVEADLGRPESAAEVCRAMEAELGPAHILVNNATVSFDGNIETLTADFLDRHYAVNVRGMALLCREFLQRFPGQAGGRIINMTSGQGVGPMPDELAYATTKGAVEAFTVSLSATAMPQGVTVNAIDPGATNTGWMSNEQIAAWSASAPTGRVGLPGDAARLAAFLASDDAAWITGQILRSRGGA